MSPANKPVPAYSPKALLDPRGTRRPAKAQDSSPYLSMSGTGSELTLGTPSPKAPSSQARLHRENSGSKSMIENLYGVERRAERPVKRVKRDPNQEDSITKGKGSARPHNSSGIIGEYMRGNLDDQDRVTTIRKVVDLTNGASMSIRLTSLTN